jgi:signal peptidase I
MTAMSVGLLGVLACAGAVVLLRRRLFVVIVAGASMEPSLRDGERLLARRTTLAQVRRGDVVILERPDEDLNWARPPASRQAANRSLLIKRIAALPGDPPPRAAAPALAEHPADLVPPGRLVAFGDNYHHSLDSKQIGYFPADRLVGVALRRHPTTRLLRQ